MLSASFDLLHEGAPYSPMLTIGGMIIGALFIKASQDYLARVRRGKLGQSGIRCKNKGVCLGQDGFMALKVMPG